MKRFLYLAAAGLAALAMAGAAGADQTYGDASGDSGAGTDLRSATVTNDPAGNISMAVTVGNPLLSNHVIVVFIDSDNNAGTGAPGIGAEYEMFAFPTAGGQILSWNGSTFAAATAPSFRAVRGRQRPDVRVQPVRRREPVGVRVRDRQRQHRQRLGRTSGT